MGDTVTVGGIREGQKTMVTAIFIKKLMGDGCKSLGKMKCVLRFATPLITDNEFQDL